MSQNTGQHLSPLDICQLFAVPLCPAKSPLKLKAQRLKRTIRSSANQGLPGGLHCIMLYAIPRDVLSLSFHCV